MTTAPAAVAALPTGPGVYRFRDARGRTLYVGRAVNLRRRVGSYWRPLRDRAHLARMVHRIERVEAVWCDSEHEAAWLERNLLEHALPPWNRAPGGAENPVHLRLDPGAHRPGVTVVHVPAPAPGIRHFGPYLGGRRTRLAASALHRVVALSYRRDGITGAERELADLLRFTGREASDRRLAVRTVTAVLERDPAAVATIREALSSRRDRASDAQAYELAARIQEEIAAIAWVTAEQKVTIAVESADPGTAEVHGWYDGVLVQFRIRSGRLCEWHQRTCPQQRAADRLRRTPTRWRPFAERNARLAASLRA